MDDSFIICLSSKGSQVYFPGNNSNSFTNVLAVQLNDMLQYKVQLASFVLSPPLLDDSTVIHVISDIVIPSLYDNNKLPLIAMVPSFNGWNVKPAYVPLSRD